VHRDLRPHNILLTHDFEPMVCVVAAVLFNLKFEVLILVWQIFLECLLRDVVFDVTRLETLDLQDGNQMVIVVWRPGLLALLGMRSSSYVFAVFEF
jgi:hypothetical protein